MKIYVAGHRGMVGSSILKEIELQKEQGQDIQLVTKSKEELNLTQQREVEEFIKMNKPDQIYLSAAKVGGIYANNTYPAQFIYENLMIQNNIINSAHKFGVKKLLFLGSSCIYPRLADQPMKEEYLLTGLLEPTNEPYAIAKIAGIKLCESYNRQYGVDFRSIMPTNLYGPGDNFHKRDSHVIPALLRRFHEAKENNQKSIKIWGSGNQFREFLHVNDMASASIFIQNMDFSKYKANTESMLSHINVGSGSEIKIRDLAQIISDVIQYKGTILFDESKPDGAPRKLMDSNLINLLGWRPKIHLKEGIAETYQWFLENKESLKD